MPSLSVRVESSSLEVAQHIARGLSDLALAITPAQGDSVQYGLLYRSAPPPADLTRLLERLRPFRLRAQHAPDLDVDILLRVGVPELRNLSKWKIRLRTDSGPLTAELAEAFRALGFNVNVPADQPPFVAKATMQYGGAPDAVRALIGWTARCLGCEPCDQSKAWDDSDSDVYLDLPAPERTELPLRERVALTVRTDTPEAFAAIAPLLRGAGFTRISLATLAIGDETRLQLHLGALQRAGAHLEIADITRAMDEAGKTLGVDWSLYPMEIADPSGSPEGDVTIDLPIAALRSGQLRPWSRMHPGRYVAIIYNDDRQAARELAGKLEELGFRAQCRRLSAITEGFVLRCGRRVPESLRELVGAQIDASMIGMGAAEYGLSCPIADGEKIEIELPARAHRDGKLREELTRASRYAVKITAPSREVGQKLVDALRPWGFRSMTLEVDTDDDPPQLTYGGARPEMLDRIETTVGAMFGPVEFGRDKAWPMSDNDIYVRLPSTLTLPAAGPPTDAHPSLEKSRFRPAPARSAPVRGKLIEVSDAELRIADQVLQRRPGTRHSSRALSPERFRGFCVDGEVARTLYFLAMASRGRYPAALEGPTAASKTWSIMYLASLLGVPVHRLNLSAQSDVSELVGRFVPDTERAGAFRWQHGPAPLAMTEGGWLVVDEADLAPTEILERCNPILETPDPQLDLSEYDGRLIADVDRDFRVLATWNGVSYAGRQELSPAFLDRFKTRVCSPPTEEDYRLLGECLVHGSQPQVEVAGARYQGGCEAPLLPELAGLVHNFDRFLAAFARFQSGLARMADRHELRSRGRIAFTRRAFVDALKVMRDQLISDGEARPNQKTVMQAAWQALSLCHLERLDPNAERDKAITLLGACGIGPDAWELPQ